jgi:hypothetical protein
MLQSDKVVRGYEGGACGVRNSAACASIVHRQAQQVQVASMPHVILPASPALTSCRLRHTMHIIQADW